MADSNGRLQMPISKGVSKFYKAQPSFMDTLAAYGKDNPLTRAGEYWANDNAEFEKTNPGFMARMGRSLDPRTNFGSAMGSMHSAASEGDAIGMATAGIGAVPLCGKLKEGAKWAPNLAQMAWQLKDDVSIAGQEVYNANHDKSLMQTLAEWAIPGANARSK